MLHWRQHTLPYKRSFLRRLWSKGCIPHKIHLQYSPFSTRKKWKFACLFRKEPGSQGKQLLRSPLEPNPHVGPLHGWPDGWWTLLWIWIMSLPQDTWTQLYLYWNFTFVFVSNFIFIKKWYNVHAITTNQPPFLTISLILVSKFSKKLS